MTDEDFIERYGITSRTGRLYTRTMLLRMVSRRAGLLRLLTIARKDVADVLDDSTWLSRRRHETPTAVVDDAIFEAHNRVRMNAHRSIPAVVCPRCTKGRGTPRGCSYCTGTGEPYAETPALAIDHAILAAMPGLGDHPRPDSVTSEQSRQVAGCIERKSSERVREVS